MKSPGLVSKLSWIFQNGENSRVKELENLEKNWQCLCPLREKSTGFHMIQMKKKFDEVVDLGYGNSFHLLTSEHLLQMTIFENMVEFDIFYRDPKKCFSPFRSFPT